MELGGRKWHARHRENALELTQVETKDNREEQRGERVANINNEVQHRKQELEALVPEKARLSALVEAVRVRTLDVAYGLGGFH